jgi:hypothetical protein
LFVATGNINGGVSVHSTELSSKEACYSALTELILKAQEIKLINTFGVKMQIKGSCVEDTQ